jgi:hypothetical protein
MSWKGVRFALALTPLLCAPGALAAGSTAIVDTLTTGHNAVRVLIYSDPDNPYPNLRKIGLIAVVEGPRVNSIAFDVGEWPTMMTLWSKAVAAQSGHWRSIGTFTDGAGADASTLDVRSGPGVALVVQSPAKGTATYVLTPADLARFGATLRKAQQSFARETGP